MRGICLSDTGNLSRRQQSSGVVDRSRHDLYFGQSRLNVSRLSFGDRISDTVEPARTNANIGGSDVMFMHAHEQLSLSQ